MTEGVKNGFLVQKIIKLYGSFWGIFLEIFVESFT